MANTEEIIQQMRDRASASRRLHLQFIYAMVAVAFAMIVFFIWSQNQDNFGIIVPETLKSEQSSGGSAISFIDVITRSVIRISAVVISIYIIQILFNLTRYHIRVANHLEMCADALTISEGDLTQLGSLLNAMTLSDIDFGRSPTLPTEKVMNVASEALKKLPDKK